LFYSFPPRVKKDRVKGLNTGADVYMVKPFEPEEWWLKQAFRQQSNSKLMATTKGKIQVPFDALDQRVVQFVAKSG